MKKLLLIMGDLAAGKSTFAKLLSERYNTIVFSKDTIKEVLGDTIGFSDRQENLKLSAATMELMIFLFSEFGKLGKDLILESNFHAPELERLHQIALKCGYEVLILVLRGDVLILHERYLKRIQHGNRHPVHLSTTLDVFEDFKAYTEHSRKEEIKGNVITINADDFSYQQDEKLLGKLDEFMEQEK
ncbi:MAG: AAA family ATPase [Lachnospiraceae bacterium]